MNRLGLIAKTTYLTAALVLPGCIIDHGLGETAEESGGTGLEDSSDGTATPPDPSATSGAPSTTADPSFTSGSDATATDGDPTSTSSDDATATDSDPSETDGDPICELDPDYVRWMFDDTNLAPLTGIPASFAAILSGECTVGEIVETPGMEGDPFWAIPMQCTLSGRIDGDPMVMGDFSPTIQMTGTVPVAEVTDLLAQPVRLSVVLDWWGMGWNGWVVVEDLEGVPLLDLFHAEHVDPISSTWGLEVAELLAGEPWHKGLHVGTTEGECGGPLTTCSDEPRAITVGWIEESPLVLHPYQEGTVGTPFEELWIRASVTAAHSFPMPTCTDMPLASYAMAAWAGTP